MLSLGKIIFSIVMVRYEDRQGGEDPLIEKLHYLTITNLSHSLNC